MSDFMKSLIQWLVSIVLAILFFILSGFLLKKMKMFANDAKKGLRMLIQIIVSIIGFFIGGALATAGLDAYEARTSATE